MIGLVIISVILSLALFVFMLSVMIVFERDMPKRILIWTLIFLFLQPIGYIAYLINRLIIHYKKSSLEDKHIDDNVYSALVSKNLVAKDIKSLDELLAFNERAFNAKVRNNTSLDFISDYSKLKGSLTKDIKQASSFVYLELTSLNFNDNMPLLDSLVEVADRGVEVRICIDRYIPRKVLKNLRLHNIKIRRFSKHNSYDKKYSNLRNVIVIDGRVAYLARLNTKKAELDTKYDLADSFIKLKGEIVQDITIKLCQDIMYSTGKHVDISLDISADLKSNSSFQYVTNEVGDKIELLLVKAICSAKESITLELDKFIPSETIMQLLKYAVDSGIAVALMVPIRSTNMSRYYASRAYAKELALMGASVYLYDGYIRFNSIVVDGKWAILGGYSIDRVDIGSSAQNMLITDDAKVIIYYKRTFDNHINNSYKINNAKYMLVREKIFKNFI